VKIQTIHSQIWWVALFDEIRPIKVRPPGALLEAIQSAFSFRVVPTEFKPGQGIEYHQGVFHAPEGPIAIEKLATFNDGLNIAVPSSTNDADRVLEKTLEIAFSLGIREPITPPAHTYVSSIVVDFDCSIDNFLPSFLYEELAKLAPKNGAAHALSFGFQFDPLLLERRPLAPGNPGFRIERREGFPYEANRYFSIANMPTTTHLSLLEQFEASARKARG
jgi:hypothetical protein